MAKPINPLCSAEDDAKSDTPTEGHKDHLSQRISHIVFHIAIARAPPFPRPTRVESRESRNMEPESLVRKAL